MSKAQEFVKRTCAERDQLLRAAEGAATLTEYIDHLRGILAWGAEVERAAEWDPLDAAFRVEAQALAAHGRRVLLTLAGMGGAGTNRRLADDLGMPIEEAALVVYLLRKLGCVSAIKVGRELRLRAVGEIVTRT